MKKISPLVWLLAVFTALAIFYSLILPLFEGPDEDDHFRYVKYVADHRALPVQKFETGGGEAGHQGWQPPLYYTLAALLISPLDTSDYSEHLVRNEYVALVGDGACCGRNIYYHFGNENFPYMRTTLAVHLARLLSILFGAITVAATYAIAKSIANYQLPISQSFNLSFSLAAASLVAFNPSFLFASALVSNDTALTAFSSLTLLAWVKLLRDQTQLNPKGTFSLKSAARLGALVALGVLTKTTALGLVPLTLLLFASLAWRQRSARTFLLAAFAFFVPFALLALWWFIRNQLLYGDPLALRLVNISALFPREGPLTLAEFFQISLPQMWRTFWGGPTPADFSAPLLILLAILTMLALIGAIIAFKRITNYESRITLLFLFAWLALIFVSQIQFIRTTQGGDQGRYLFPAISVLALSLVLGLNQIANNQLRIINLSLVIFSFVIGIFVPFAYTLPAYARPVLLSQTDQARYESTHAAARTNFANQIELLGSELGSRSNRPGETLRVTLAWRALAPMSQSYRVFVHLVGQNDASAGGVDVIPARGAFPTLYWNPGDALQENYYLPITNNAFPGKYSVEVGLYPIGKPSERLMTTAGDDRAVISSIKIAPRELVAYTPNTRINAAFGDQIELLGYDVAPSQDSTRIVLYWRAQRAMDRDYKIFIHALDASGRIIAQVDREPQNGNYPTSIWDAGEQVRDEYALPMLTKNLRLELGWYHADTGERLLVRFNGQPSDHIELTLGVTP